MIGNETVINLQHTKVYVFSDSVLCLGKIHQHPDSNEAWKKRIEGITTHKSYRDYDGINGEPTEFEWNIFPGFTTLQLKGNKEECLANARVVKVLTRKFGVGQWSFIGPGSENKWYSAENSPQGARDHIAEEMLLEFAESGHLIFRVTTSLSRVFSRTEDMENCEYTSLQIIQQFKLFFASIFLPISSVSTEQWRLYVKNLRIIKMYRVNLRF